jgi:hypothetical protein
MTERPSVLPRPSLARVVMDQRKTVFAALAMVVASVWLLGPLADWPTALCAAGGVLLGLVNHLATEYWLAKVISSGEEPTRAKIAMSAFTRLVILAAVAVAVAVAVWPAGIALLLCLAIFRLVALVMTGLPLLKELRNA